MDTFKDIPPKLDHWWKCSVNTIQNKADKSDHKNKCGEKNKPR
jgi:hypothetical protein